MLNSKISNHLRAHFPFYLLLALGVLLRLWMMLGSGLSNDELSAWHRTRMDAWDDFWYYGVQYGDMHPVFYQALLWVWVRLVGDSDFLFRLPALLFWLGSMTLLYRIACQHFSKFSGWMIVAMYAGLSFFVVNTTTSRPYNSGVFFILLAWALYLRKLKNQERFDWKSLGVLVLALIGAMLSHYFASLTIGLISCVAFLFGNKHQKVHIATAGIIAVGLFFLHFSVTWFQLNRGGLGWLGAPKWYWLADFWHQVFQYVWLFSIPVAGYLVFAGFKSRWNVQRKFTLVAVFVVCMVAYVLSITFTPILREAVIQFFFPLLVLGIMGGFSLKNKKWNALIPVLIGGVFFVHTAIVRTPSAPIHYGVFKEIGEARNKLQYAYNESNTADLVNVNDTSYLHRYMEVEADFNLGYVENDSMVINAFRFADTCMKENLFYAWTNNFHSAMHFEALRQHYPFAIAGQSYFGSAYYLLSKNKEMDAVEHGLIEQLVQSDTLIQTEFALNKKWSVGALRQQLPSAAYLNFKLELDDKPKDELFLVAVAEDQHGMRMNDADPVFYRASEISRFCSKKNTGFLALELKEQLLDGDFLHFYIWNPSKQAFRVKQLTVEWVQPPSGL